MLKGNEEEKIRLLFNQKLIEFLEKNDEYLLEAKHNDILIYTEKTAVMTVEEVQKLFDFGKSLLEIIALTELEPSALVQSS
jgi:hypothetical protein